MAGNAAWYLTKICPQCGKTFPVRNTNDWAYKTACGHGMKYFCTWGCLCAHRKKKEANPKEYRRMMYGEGKLYADSLRDIRLCFRLRQRDVAAHIGASVNNIEEYEKGYPIPERRLNQLAEAFGCTEDDLLSGRFAPEDAATWKCVIKRAGGGRAPRGMAENKAVLGENIRARRLENEWTAAGFARAIGVTAPSLCNYEKGRTMPSDPVLDRIAYAFGCTVDDLFTADAKKEKSARE